MAKTPFFVVVNYPGTEERVWVSPGPKKKLEDAGLTVYESRNIRWDWCYLVDRKKALEMIDKRIVEQGGTPIYNKED